MGYWRGMALLKAPLLALAGFLLLAVVTLSPKHPPTDQLGALAVAAQPTTDDTQATTNNVPPTSNALSIIVPTQSQLRSAIEASFTQGLPPSLISQPKGPKGDPGPAGSPATALAPAGYSTGSVYSTATSTNTGTIGGISTSAPRTSPPRRSPSPHLHSHHGLRGQHLRHRRLFRRFLHLLRHLSSLTVSGTASLSTPSGSLPVAMRGMWGWGRGHRYSRLM